MLKRMIRDHLIRKRDEQYEKELLEKIDSYSNWYRLHKRELDRKLVAGDHTAGNALSREVVRYSHLRNHLLSGDKLADIVIC